MNDGSGLVEIVIFGLIAAFFVLWFRSILGQRHGDERQRANPFVPKDEQADAEEEDNQDYEASNRGKRRPGLSGFVIDFDFPIVQPDQPQSIAVLIRALQAQDPDFDEKEFLSGAEGAFRYIVEAFADGDIETLEGLVDGEVLQGFVAAIEERIERKETLISKIKSVSDVDIVGIDLNGGVAEIRVNIESEQSHLVLADGEDESSKDPAETELIVDVWTFRRDLNSDDPNWSLVQTDVAE